MTWILGHRGMVGSAIGRALDARGEEWDGDAGLLEDWSDPEGSKVYVAAARVGGIQANIARPADFLMENLRIQMCVLDGARDGGGNLLFLGSSCMYPRDCPQPMKESDLLSGPPEPTNRAYAIAKIAGMEMVRAYRQQYGCRFITAIPCNLYGPGDHYEPERAHVIPSLIRRFVEAKCAGAASVTVWGSGQARREFMHVDDCAKAMVFLMDRYDSDDPINVGTGTDITIADLAGLIRECVGYKGDIAFDSSQPEGAPRKLLDVSRLTALGWKPKIWLEGGLRRTIEEYMERR